MRKVRFPKISANVDEATITRWAKAEGDLVEQGELLVEITTDKGVVEVESPAGGTLRRIVAPENSTLPVGSIIALIGDVDEPLPDVDATNREIMTRHLAQATLASRPNRRSNMPSDSKVRATPAARKLAAKAGVDLALIQAEVQAKVLTDSIVNDYLNKKNHS